MTRTAISDISSTAWKGTAPGFPAGHAERLATGWKTNYWDPLAKYLA
jgi:hypothetical protein